MKAPINHRSFNRHPAWLLLLLALVALGTWGCGRGPAKAKEQVQGQLTDYPHYPVRQDQKVFTLTDSADNTVTYRTGTMVILNPALAPADLANLMEIAKAIRLARADAVHHTNDAAVKIKQYRQTVAATEDLIKQQRQLQSQRVSKEQRAVHAATWFADILKQENIPSTQYNDLMDTFAGYCEAKIWQLAAQPYFANQRYLQRPTPLALCNKYYEDHGLLAASATSCANADDSQGKYYIQCLWEEGVMKTALFQHHFKDKTAAFADLVSARKREDFRMILAAVMDTANTTDPRLVSPRLKGKIHTAIMGLRKLNARCNVRLFEIKLGEMCTLFVSSNPASAPTGVGSIATWDLSPGVLIDLVENNQPALEMVGEGLLTTASARQFVLPQRPDNLIAYQHLLLFFGTRTETAPSESDTIFHVPVPPTNVAAAGISAIASLPKHDLSVDDYRGALGAIYPKVTPEDEAIIIGLQNQIKETNASILTTEGDAGKYDKKVTDLLNAGISAAKAPSLAYAFTNLGLQITKKNALYTLEFWFGEDSRSAGDQKKRVKGCYDTIARTSLAGTNCLDHDDYQLAATSFTYNPQTGELLLAFPFAAAAQMGFKAPSTDGQDASRSDYFNTIPLAGLVDTTMEMQLFPNTVGGVVNILTGKVFIKPKGWHPDDDYLYEGVVAIFDNQ